MHLRHKVFQVFLIMMCDDEIVAITDILLSSQLMLYPLVKLVQIYIPE